MIHLLSDLHLAPGDGLTRRFVEYMAGAGRDASVIFILGDLFNVWLGDDLSMPEHGAAIDAISGAVDAGVQVHVMHGNRDFLLGPIFESATGATLISDPWVGELAGIVTLLTHGDRYCTQDRSYQAFRSVVRSRAVQRGFYGMPQRWRVGLATRLRQGSRQATPGKPLQITDLDSRALYQAVRDAQASRVIHGHSHRPAVHRVGKGKQMIERHVLEDWRTDTGGRVMTIDREGRTGSLRVPPPENIAA